MGAGMDRRTFLRAAAGVAGGALLGSVPAAGAPMPTGPDSKLIIVLFGGGTRSSETIADPEHRHIPRLWGEMAPRGTLFTNMRVEGKVVHPNSAGSIVTGHWEWDDLDWSRPPAHPTVFEVLRRERSAPDTAAWAFVYASILAKTGASRAAGFGERFGANVVVPPVIPRTTAERMDRLMAQAGSLGSAEAELDASRSAARLARGTASLWREGLRSGATRAFVDEQYRAWQSGEGTTSHDAFLTDRAVACMGTFAPDVLMVAFGEIDCAHYGSWSRYVEAIRRTDELTWRLWRAAQDLPGYRDRTLMLILPDHGRELDRAGRWGFIHHSDFYTGEGADEGCRRVWMLALGPGVRPGRTVERPVPITSVAATGLRHLGLGPSAGAAGPALDTA